MPNQEKKYFRNKVEIENVEPLCLWELSDKYFILVDDDEFISVLVSENWDKFIKVDIVIS